MSKNLTIRPESNNSVTVFLDDAAFRLLRVGKQLLIFPPDGYSAEVRDGGNVTIQPDEVATEGASSAAPECHIEAALAEPTKPDAQTQATVKSDASASPR